MTASSMQTSGAEDVIEAITRKLKAHRDVVADADYGRLTWRRTAKGTLEIKLEPGL